MIAPYVALDVPSEVEAFGDSGGGEDGRELGWSRLRLLNSVVCVVRDCVDTILSHAAEHADRIDTDAEGGAEGAPRGVFLWDDSMSQVIGVDIIRQRLLPCLALFLKHGGPSNRPPGVSRFAVCLMRSVAGQGCSGSLICNRWVRCATLGVWLCRAAPMPSDRRAVWARTERATRGLCCWRSAAAFGTWRQRRHRRPRSGYRRRQWSSPMRCRGSRPQSISARCGAAAR